MKDPAKAGKPLTAREAEILALAAEGLGNAEIAVRLVLSVSTVKWHVESLLVKLEASNRVAAVQKALRLGLIAGDAAAAGAAAAPDIPCPETRQPCPVCLGTGKRMEFGPGGAKAATCFGCTGAGTVTPARAAEIEAEMMHQAEEARRQAGPLLRPSTP